MIDVRVRHKLVDGSVESEIYQIIDDLSNTHTLSCPGGGPKRSNVNVPSRYWCMVKDLGDAIGMPYGTVAVLTIMMELSKQEETIKGDAEDLYRHVRSFFRTMVAKTEACNALLKVYNLGEKG
jgi:hypothetical protein